MSNEQVEHTPRTLPPPAGGSPSNGGASLTPRGDSSQGSNSFGDSRGSGTGSDSSSGKWSHPRYAFLSPLGSGGFANVFLARDLELETNVAIKVLRDFQRDTLSAMRQEFRAIKDIQHPNLVQLFELHGESRDVFFTMEALHGQSADIHVELIPTKDRDKETRAVLAQVAEGLGALHAQGTLHRDLKPTNILVTQEGRAVVLDAGLAKAVEEQHTVEVYLAGTAVYSSPEQLRGDRLGFASDWYSFGVVAFQLFGGEAPFPWNLGKAMVAKTKPPPSLTILRSSIDPKDEEMVRRLMDPDPLERPGLEDIREWLKDAGVPRARMSAPAMVERIFVGRTNEQKRLSKAYRRCRSGEAVGVQIVGDSGIGKSSLVKAWLSERGRERATLTGRCYQREHVPFAGFEDIVAALRDRGALNAIASRARGAIAEAFALGGELPELPADPLAKRALVSDGIGDALRALNKDKPSLIWIDDVQWGGVETGTLLADLMRQEWPSGFLMLITNRPAAEGDGACLPTLGKLITPSAKIRLGPLSQSSARELAKAHLREEADSEDQADRLVDGAAGHPLLLVQSALRLDAKSASLEGVLQARFELLEEEAKRLLVTLCVAREPLPRVLAAHAASVQTESVAAGALIREGLVERVGRGGVSIAPFHDALRRAVLELLSGDEIAQQNGAIADALRESGRSEPEKLFAYYVAAQDDARAAEYVFPAARRLVAAFSFERGAELFERGLQLNTLEGDARREAEFECADAWIQAGRSERGARQLMKLVDPNSREDDEVVARASLEFIRAGLIDEGLGLAQETMKALGVDLASTPRRTIAAVLRDRLRLKIRGMKYELRSEEKVPPLQLAAIDWCHALGAVLPVVDTMRAYQLHNQGLLMALRAGEPARLGLALAMEAGFRAVLNGASDKARVDELFKSGRVLIESTATARAWGMLDIIQGSACWSFGDYEGCIDSTERGMDFLREHCAGYLWERNFGLTHVLDAYFCVGDLPRLKTVAHTELDEATRRGDLYSRMLYTLRDLPRIALMEDDVPAARATAPAIGLWPNEGYQVAQMTLLHSQTEVDLYEGNAAQAFERLQASWKDLKGSGLLEVQPFWIDSHFLRANVYLSTAAQDARRRASLLREVKKRGTALAKRKASARATCYGNLLLAGVARLRGERDLALEHYQKSLDASRQGQMSLVENAILVRRSELQSGTEPEGQREAALQTFVDKGVKQPKLYLRQFHTEFPE